LGVEEWQLELLNLERFQSLEFLNFIQHFKIFGKLGMAAGAPETRTDPGFFYENPLKSSVLSLFPVFLELDNF
jgi:hypothetical protein